MLLTEKEAYQCICPNQLQMDEPTCVGAACMAWRWADAYPCQRIRHCIDSRAVTEPERPSSVPASWVFEPYDATDADLYAQWVEPKDEAQARRRGYCGLAGKPEER